LRPLDLKIIEEEVQWQEEVRQRKAAEHGIRAKLDEIVKEKKIKKLTQASKQAIMQIVADGRDWATAPCEWFTWDWREHSDLEYTYIERYYGAKERKHNLNHTCCVRVITQKIPNGPEKEELFRVRCQEAETLLRELLAAMTCVPDGS
jgi:hypothetical protein